MAVFIVKKVVMIPKYMENDRITTKRLCSQCALHDKVGVQYPISHQLHIVPELLLYYQSLSAITEMWWSSGERYIFEYK